MKNMDFTRSSRHAWNLMKKINPDKSKKTEKQTVISADTVAKQVEKRGMHTPKHKCEQNVGYEFQTLNHEYLILTSY